MIKNKKTSDKVWKKGIKVLIFAVRFARRTVYFFFFLRLFFPFRTESLRNELKKKK